MIAQIGSGSAGWSEYVLGKDEKREGATLIAGDTDLGDAICKTTHYKSGQYVRMVLSFSAEDTHITPEKGREIAKEFVDLFMHGYRPDEYHADIVEHTDTDNLHYHIRIPKLNLLTGTQLKIYYDKADRTRKEAIVDYLDHKYRLTRAADRRRTPQQKSQAEAERVQRWRSEHGQKPFDFRRKKGREEAQAAIDAYIEEMAAAGLITSQNEVLALLEEAGLKIEKIGHDKKRDFDYITVSNETGKLRLKGGYYGERFWQHTREDQAQPARDRGRDRELKEKLDKELAKREKWIDSRYQSARKRALKARGEDTRARVEEKPLEAMRRDLRPGHAAGRRERGSVGVEERPGVQERRRHDVDVAENQVRGENDRVGAEAIERTRRAREIRAEAIRRVSESTEASAAGVRERVEKSSGEIRAEAERDSRKAREDRGRQGFISALGRIGKAIERVGEKVRSAVKAALDHPLFSIQDERTTMEMIRETMNKHKDKATWDAVEMARKKEEAPPLWQQPRSGVRRKL